MREDPLILKKHGNATRTSTGHDETANSFFTAYNNLIERIGADKKAAIYAKYRPNLTDPYGWALVFHDYKFTAKDGKKNCRDIFSRESPTFVLDKDKKRFHKMVEILYTVFNFDLKSFYDVFYYQGDIVDMLKQIVQPRLFIGNRFRGFRSQSTKLDAAIDVYPNKYAKLQVPPLNYLCDGLDFPVNVCRNTNNIEIKTLDVGNFDDGDFVVMDDEVIDCLRIGDMWLTDKSLKQRLKFIHAAKAEEAMMLNVYSLGEIKKYGYLLNYGSEEGILIRPLGQNFYNNYWFVLNEDSYYMSYVDKHGNLSYNRTHKACFFDMRDNNVGTCNLDSKKISKTVWLDDYDVNRFKSLLLSDNGVFE